ncbi:MAG TPA: hypothetical protein VNA89_08680 [Gemmatimonadaceae bacterium]|nr:hypothetical protein [Gemmatimonadaceae bacterium]
MRVLPRALAMLALGAGGLLTGCASNPRPGESSELTRATVGGARSGDLARFVPLVGALQEGGECDTLYLGAADARETVVVYSFPNRRSSQRNIALTFDAAGQLRHFSDVRGDLRQDPVGAQTSVTLDFVHRAAYATNKRPGEPERLTAGKLEEGLTASNLGRPQDTIDLVRARCWVR